MSEGLIDTGIKVVKFLTEMRKRDLLLMGFVGLFVLLIGVLTGYVPSPVVAFAADHMMIKEQNASLIEIAKLQLYLSRENCMHTAKTETEKARCDRQSIRDAILGDILPSEKNSTEPLPIDP